MWNGQSDDIKNIDCFNRLKGPGKRGHIVADTLLLMMFLGRANARDTK